MELNREQALDRASGLCMKSEHCEKDIRTKLRQWHVDEREWDYIIKRLRDEKFIDDSRYARAFVREKSRINKWGAMKIKFALSAKGIDESTIRTAIDENIDGDETLARLTELMRNKRKFIKDDDPRAVRVKLMRFAAARGFSMDQINQALRKMKCPEE